MALYASSVFVLIYAVLQTPSAIKMRINSASDHAMLVLVADQGLTVIGREAESLARRTRRMPPLREWERNREDGARGVGVLPGNRLAVVCRLAAE